MFTPEVKQKQITRLVGKVFRSLRMGLEKIHYLCSEKPKDYMIYPTISEYIEAIKAAEENFEELKNLRPVLGYSKSVAGN